MKAVILLGAALWAAACAVSASTSTLLRGATLQSGPALLLDSRMPMGVVNMEDCKLTLRDLRFSGDIEALYAPAGAISSEMLAARSTRRLDYELTVTSPGSWTLTATLPDCNQQAAVQRVAVWCERCTFGTQTVQAALVASTAEPVDSATHEGDAVVLVLRNAELLDVAPAGRTSRSLLSACTQGYAACFPATGVGKNFNVAWNLEPDPTDSASSLLSMALDATSTGYVAVGFPSNPGEMVGATAMILQTCSSCPSGASMTEYYMSAKSLRGVVPDTRMGATNLTAAAAGGQLAGSFQVKLPGSAAADATAYPMIYVAGPLDSSGGLLQHVDDGASNVNFTAALKSDSGSTVVSVDTSSGSSSTDLATLWHMWLMAVGWGTIIPSGIVVARSFKPHGTWWFQVHRALQSLGFIMGVVGLALGFKASGGWVVDQPVHRNLGVAATSLGLLQVLALVIRPKPGTKYRPVWSHYHAWVGRTAAILAIYNIYYGIINVQQLGAWAWAAYTSVLGTIVLVGVGKDTHDYLRCHKALNAPSRTEPSKPVSRIVSRFDSDNAKASGIIAFQSSDAILEDGMYSHDGEDGTPVSATTARRPSLSTELSARFRTTSTDFAAAARARKSSDFGEMARNPSLDL